MLKALSLVLLVSTIDGLKLPGPCPNMPPNRISDYFGSLYAHIPFDGFESHIFSSPNHEIDLMVTLSVNKRTSQIRLQCGTLAEVVRKANFTVAVHGAVHVKSFVEVLGKKNYEPLLCRKPLDETLRMWIYQDLGIFWSCRESVLLPGTHDEAVLIAGKSVVQSKWTEELLKYKPNISLVLGEALVARLNWNISEGIPCNTQHLLACPAFAVDRLKFIFLGFSLLIIGYSVVYLLCDLKTQNRVGVVNGD